MPRRFFREDFDRERSFVAKRSFVFAGQGYVPGQSIDKTQFTVRRLRQLYDQRYIDFGLDDVAPVLPVAPPAPPIVPRRKFTPPTVMKPAVPRRRKIGRAHV